MRSLVLCLFILFSQSVFSEVLKTEVKPIALAVGTASPHLELGYWDIVEKTYEVIENANCSLGSLVINVYDFSHDQEIPETLESAHKCIFETDTVKTVTVEFMPRFYYAIIRDFDSGKYSKKLVYEERVILYSGFNDLGEEITFSTILGESQNAVGGWSVVYGVIYRGVNAIGFNSNLTFQIQGP